MLKRRKTTSSMMTHGGMKGRSDCSRLAAHRRIAKIRQVTGELPVSILMIMVALLAMSHYLSNISIPNFFFLFSTNLTKRSYSMSVSSKRYVFRSSSSNSVSGRVSRRIQYNGESSFRRTPFKRNVSSTPVSYSPPSGVQSPSLPNDIDDELIDLVVLAIDVQSRGTLGCAYYVGAEERLCAMEDISNGPVDIIEQRLVCVCFKVTANCIQ